MRTVVFFIFLLSGCSGRYVPQKCDLNSVLEPRCAFDTWTGEMKYFLLDKEVTRDIAMGGYPINKE